MASFDYFSQPTGPVIPINLFGDAATQGINAGNAKPSQTTAIIQGAIKGIGQGQQIVQGFQQIEANSQNAEIRQNTIDTLPTANAIQKEQLKSAQTRNEIQDMDLQIQKNSQDLNANIAKLQKQNELAKLKQQNEDYNAYDSIQTSLSNPDINIQKDALFNPKYGGFYSRNKDYAENVVGQLIQKGALNEQEKQAALSTIDVFKAQEVQNTKLKINQQLQAALTKDLDAVTEKLSDPAIKEIVKGMDADQIKDNIEIYKNGQKQLNPDGTINKQAADLPVSPAEKNYQVFVNGKVWKDTLNDSQAGVLSSFQDTYRRTLEGLSPSQDIINKKKVDPTKTPEAPANIIGTPEKEVPKAPLTIENLQKKLTDEGLSADETQKFLGSAKEEGATRNFVERQLDSILPPIGIPQVNVDESMADLMMNTDINDPSSFQAGATLTPMSRDVIKTASNLADKTLEKFKNGTPEEKQTARDWAEANNVKLTKGSLKDYYTEKLLPIVNDAAQKAFTIGVDERAKATRAQNAKDASQVTKASELEGLTVDEAIQYQKKKVSILGNNQVASKPEGVTLDKTSSLSDLNPFSASKVEAEELPTKVDEMAEKYNLTPKEKQNTQKVAVKINANPFFEGTPSYVKALGAVESGGNVNAVSSTGVKGLLQVTQRVAASYGLNRNIPAENVEAGQRYYEDLLQMFKGNKQLAYAAYNIGPAVVREAQKLANNSNDWLEVKDFIYDAAKKYEKQLGKTAAQALKEVYNYPERALFAEELFT